ncbi:MAG: hypothetical protein HY796_06160 [Elusimicrobia bacterium]|nr:hypothetical protein [Elusimicrobiota bacterium]
MPARQIKKKLNAWRARYILAKLCGALLECAGLGFWLGAAAMGAAVFFELSREQRLVFAVSAGLYLVFRFYNSFIRSLPSFGLERFSGVVESRLPGLKRHLRAALDLSAGGCPPGASSAFIERHLEVTAARLKLEKRPDFMSFGAVAAKKRLVVFASGLCAAGFFAWTAPEAFYGLLHPFSAAPLESIMEIRPGNAGLLRGSAFKIEAVFKNGGRSARPGAASLGGAELFLKNPGGGWAGGFMQAAGPGRFAYEVENLSEDLFYKFRYKGLESAAYRVNALDAPSLKDPVFSVLPPAYTGAPKTDYPYLPAETEALKGSLASVSGTCAQKLESAGVVFAGSGLKIPLSLSDGRLAARFAVFEDLSYQLELKTAGGLSAGGGQNSGGRIHLIKAKEDEPPLITLLSPVFPLLEAAPQEELKAVYEAEDDIGLAELGLERKVFLNGRADAELSFSRSVRSFPEPSVRRFPGEAALELYDLPDGARAEFYLRACDRAPGRLCAKSEPVNIKVTDFDARHAAAYAGFEALRRSAAALKGKEDEIIERLKSSAGTFSTTEMDRLSAAWKDLALDAGRLGKTLAGDPYTGEGARERYGLVERELSYGARAALEKAVPETLAGRNAQALKAHKELSGALGAGIGELEAMLRWEGARSAVFGFESMTQNTEAMAETLAGGGPDSDADWKKLERTLAKIASELARIQAMLKDRPPPADGGKTFALPAGSALGTAGELARAIAQRDAGKAAKLAAKLAEALSQMRRVMEEYSDHEAAQSRAGAESSKIGELAEAWKALYEAQSAELSANREFEESVFLKTEKAKAVMFNELTALQDGLVGSLAAYKAENPEAYSAAASAQSFLRAKNIENARSMIEKAGLELKKSSALQQQGRGVKVEGRGDGDDATVSVSTASSFILHPSSFSLALLMVSKLGSDAAFLEPAELEFFEPAAKRQDEIEAESGGLYAKIDGGYSGELAAKLLERLEKAGGHMRKASQALTDKEIRPAVSSQLKALEELELGGEDLDNMLQSLKKAQGSSAGSGRPSGVFARSADGMNVSPVRLPKPGDYVPSGDLRKKVMDSLRERYPASRKELIEEYFKNITK